MIRLPHRKELNHMAKRLNWITLGFTGGDGHGRSPARHIQFASVAKFQLIVLLLFMSRFADHWVDRRVTH